MQPLNVNDVLQCTVEGTNEGMPWNIVRHYLVEASADPAGDLLALASFWSDTILAALDDNLTDQWQAECIRISRVAPNPMNVYFHSFASPVVGDVTTDGLPNQAAVLIRLSSNEVGARNRGRIYLCGIPEAATDGGVLDSTYMGNLSADATVFALASTGSGYSFQPVIFSRTQYAANPAAAVTAYTAPIADVSVQANIAIQRRRRYPRSVPSTP